jgi:hypothetical protein
VIALLRNVFVLLGVSAVALGLVCEIPAQEPAGAAAVTPAGRTVVPPLVRYAGVAANREGDTVEAVFRIYAAPEDGEPLWTETQKIMIGQDGKYSVLLGAVTAGGVPSALFADGQARWLGVSMERAAEQPRTPLASVAYAMKAGDADTVGGLAASDLVTRAQLASTAQQLAAQTNIGSGGLKPDITPSGSGTAGNIPLWTNATTLGNAAIHQGGTAAAPLVGVNTASPAATLEVAGTGIFTGNLHLSSGAAATTTAGVNSPQMSFGASSYSSTTAKAIAQNFAWQAVPTGNKTASPSAGLKLLFGAGTAAPVATGLEIASNGQITFAAGQKFPGTSAGGGTITGVTAGTGLTGGGTTGAVTLNVNTTALEPVLNNTYAQLSAQNVFTGTTNYFNGYAQFGNGASVTASPSEASAALTVDDYNGAAGSEAIYASTAYTSGIAIYADGTENGIAMAAYASESPSSIGILGGFEDLGSGTFNLDNTTRGYSAGVWADALTNTTSALIATADDTNSGVFENNSASAPTIYVGNFSKGGPTGQATLLRAEGPDGVCGINQSGSMACTGQMKAVVATHDGARQVETYTVQSAENWIEDYGTGQLEGGVTVVRIDPAFAEIVNGQMDYHVFLTPRGDCEGLYVSNLTADSFEVHELRAGKASVAFDYKIAARRSGHENERLVDVTARMKFEKEAGTPKAFAKSKTAPVGKRRPHPTAARKPL